MCNEQPIMYYRDVIITGSAVGLESNRISFLIRLPFPNDFRVGRITPPKQGVWVVCSWVTQLTGGDASCERKKEAEASLPWIINTFGTAPRDGVSWREHPRRQRGLLCDVQRNIAFPCKFPSPRRPDYTMERVTGWSLRASTPIAPPASPHLAKKSDLWSPACSVSPRGFVK